MRAVGFQAAREMAGYIIQFARQLLDALDGLACNIWMIIERPRDCGMRDARTLSQLFNSDTLGISQLIVYVAR